MQIVYRSSIEQKILTIEGPYDKIDFQQVKYQVENEQYTGLSIDDRRYQWGFLDLHFLKGLPMISGLYLIVFDCDLQLIEQYLPDLKFISIFAHEKHGKILNIEKFNNLETLTLSNVSINLTNPATSIKDMTIGGKIDLNKIDFSNFPALKLLYLGGNFNNASESNLSTLKSLEGLVIVMSYRIYNLDFISGMENLHAIHLDWLPRLKKFPDISNLKKLQRVWLSDTKYEDLSGLGTSTSIEELYIKCNVKAEQVIPLAQIPSLKKVSFALISDSESKKARKVFGELYQETYWEPYYVNGP
jgi:Leucine-rich repeat (LRR) protein